MLRDGKRWNPLDCVCSFTNEKEKLREVNPNIQSVIIRFQVAKSQLKLSGCGAQLKNGFPE